MMTATGRELAGDNEWPIPCLEKCAGRLTHMHLKDPQR